MASPLSRGGFLETLKKGQLTIGTFLGLASPLAAEVASVSGVDWVLLDLEHGGGGEVFTMAGFVTKQEAGQRGQVEILCGAFEYGGQVRPRRACRRDAGDDALDVARRHLARRSGQSAGLCLELCPIGFGVCFSRS